MTVRDNDPATPGLAQVVIALRWPLAFVTVLLGAGLLAFLFYRETLSQASRAASAAGQTATELARAFKTGNVTEQFLAAIPEFDPQGSGNLEVATLTAVETFTRSDERRVLWDWVSLGIAESEIRVPVTYRYHLKLDDPWHLEVVGSTCWVWAPTIRPSLPPAIHTDRLEKRSDTDWLRFDGAEQLTQLERSITPTLSRYAADERHLDLVREKVRRVVDDFVRGWLLREGQWGIEGVHAVRVIFPGEEVDEPALPQVERRDRPPG